MLELLLILVASPSLPRAPVCPAPAAPVTRTQAEEEEERVQRALGELEAAFAAKAADARLAAIQAHAAVDDPRVIVWLAKGLRDRSREVQRAALDALGHLPHADALKALHDTYARDKQLRRDEELGVLLLKAIAFRGDVASIEVLCEEPFDTRGDTAEDAQLGALSRARILGLGRIRDPRAVEALIGMMKKAGRARVAPFMEEFRLSLLVLTGADHGTSQDEWLAWWNEHKKTLVVPPEPPPVPELDWRRWASYWGLPQVYERARRREDRGDDGRDGRRGG